MLRRAAIVSLLLALGAAIPARIISQSASLVTTPRQQFGAGIGDDYFLASYTQLEQYWHTLDRESPRLQLVDIGLTAAGRHQWMAVVTAPENVAALDRYRDLARRLAQAEHLDDGEARALAAEGKAIVWINGGLHADEVLGAQQVIELVYQLTNRSDPETLRILENTIVLVAVANPDGQELVTRWYMRRADPLRRTLEGLPTLYQQYVGHDNNRDFYMGTQPETININRVLYRDWFPQIVYDHHQPGPAGTVMFAPPFRGPYNYLFDPLLPTSIDAVGDAMHRRFAADARPGVTMRTGSNYSAWWNGGLRTTANFHNQIGILTETIGEPAPILIPSLAERQQASADLPYPIRPQLWRFRQSVDYSMTANYAVLEYAARHREELLFNVYRMGRNAIERGSRDSWTGPDGAPDAMPADPRRRDARAYILPSTQADFPTAVEFVRALLQSGVRVQRARSTFSAGGTSYPAGSFVVSTAQAFRPHVLDMFEPQQRPRDGSRPGAPPTPPYDSAGWTLALQMGVQFARIVDPVDGPFDEVSAASWPAGTVTGPSGAVGYLFSHHQNNAFAVLNRLLADKEDVYWIRDRTVGAADGSGAMYVAAGHSTGTAIRAAAAEFGVSFAGVQHAPPGEVLKIAPVRIGLWDRYGGSTASGWTRWLLQRFGFSFERVFAQALDRGDLRARYDVIILPDEAVPSTRSRREDGTDIEDLPVEYKATTGSITWNRTVPRLKEFVKSGGTLVLIGRATVIGERLGLPVDAAVADERTNDGPAGPEGYWVPGAILEAHVDNTQPLAYGFGRRVNLFFDNSPIFRIARPLQADVSAPARVAWFASPTPIRSGWGQGQERLNGGVVALDFALGQGDIAMFATPIIYRGQSHGTFKFLFNALFYGHAQPLPRLPAAGPHR